MGYRMNWSRWPAPRERTIERYGLMLHNGRRFLGVYRPAFGRGRRLVRVDRIASIESVGETFVPPDAIRHERVRLSLAGGSGRGGLSNRELEALCLAAEDMTDLEIADALFISKRTASP
ncbi:MAG: WYL domain-containing protein [Thermomicrobiales bacterium]